MSSNPPRKRRVRPVIPDAPDDPLIPDEVESSPPPRITAPDESGTTTIIPPGESEPAPARRSWVMEVGNKDVGVVLKELRDDVGYWVAKGRYNKVRVMREGKQVLPDIPVGAILAAEVAGLAWAGAIRTAVVNVAGRLLFKVELINDAKEHLAAAKDHYARGDLDEAEAETVRALKVDSRLPDGYLLLGTLAKVRGKNEEALRHFLKARDLDPHGDTGRAAEVAGRKLDPNFGGGGAAPVEKA